MAVHKVIEVLAFSEKSWEDAAQQAVNEVGETIREIESVFIQDFSAKVVDDEIVQYRVNAKITFSVE